MKDIPSIKEEALRQSVEHNIWYYYVSLFAWIGFLLYGIVYKDGYLWLASIIFLISAVNFNLSQKIDKSRLEIFLKKC